MGRHPQFKHLLLLAALAACGAPKKSTRERPEETPSTKATVQKSQDAQKGGAPTPACAEGDRRLALAPDSWVGWQAMKPLGQKVDGRFQITSDFHLEVDSVDDLKFRVDFDLGSLSTENDLRDQRIADILFGRSDDETLAFEVTSVVGADGETGLPAPGKSGVFALEGELTIAGDVLPLSVDVTVSAKNDGTLSIKPKGRLKLHPRTDLGLADRLDALLAIGKTSLAQEFVSVSFELTATNVCESP